MKYLLYMNNTNSINKVGGMKVNGVSNPVFFTGKVYKINGVEIKEVTSEVCERLYQMMRSQVVTCSCTSCQERRLNGTLQGTLK